jgi:hypothetical protein
MTDLLPRYPRTLHLGASGGGKSKHNAPLSAVRGAHLVVEEKVDGSMVGLFFDEDANLRLFHRNTILDSPPREKEFHLLHSQAELGMDALWEVLRDRYVLYGEWALLTHSIYYDALPAFFLEDDVYDRDRAAFLSTPARAALTRGLPIHFSSSVEVLAEGVFESESQLQALIASSRYRSSAWQERLRATQSDRVDELLRADQAEGLYIKHEEDGIVRARYKWVRKDFIEEIERSGKHWRSQQVLKNELRGSRGAGR